MKISVPPLRLKNFYLLTSANKTVIGNKKIEFLHDKLVSFELIDKTETDLVFKYELLNQFMQGSSLVHNWSADMEDLQSGLILIADNIGELADVYNFKSLRPKFSSVIIPQANNKYPKAFCETMIEATDALLSNKDQFLQNLVGYSSWRFFLQNFYRKHSESEAHSFSIKNHFGTVDLPLIIRQKKSSYENGKTLHYIESTATLDNKLFKKAAFARMLKDLTGVYNIDVTVNLEMEEKYTFSKEGILTEGEMFLQTAVYEWYNVTTAHQLKLIAANEVEAVKDEIETNKMGQSAIHTFSIAP